MHADELCAINTCSSNNCSLHYICMRSSGVGVEGLCVGVCVCVCLYPYEGHIIDFRLHGDVNDCKAVSARLYSLGLSNVCEVCLVEVCVSI